MNRDKTYPASSSDIRAVEKRTFRLHLISQFLNGLSFGTLLLEDVILKKSLLGSDLEVTILIFLTSSASLFSIYGVEIINRSQNKPRTIMLMGLASKSFLLFIPLFESAAYFIFCIAIMAIIEGMIKPTWNMVFKHNYTDERRSSLFSYASSVHTLALLGASLLLGYLLDINYKVYLIFFPLAGVMDIIAYYNLSRIVKLGNFDSGKKVFRIGNLSARLFKDVVILPLRNVKRIFSENKSFFRFESYFFLYGMAFMILLPAMPIFFVENLKLDYTPISIAKGLMLYSAIIIFTPLMGKLLGPKNPMKFCGILFLSLVAFPLQLILLKHLTIDHHYYSPDIMLYIAYFLFGVSMSGVILSWNIGSIYFAPHKEVSNYQAVHITLTGVRGLFSPFIGYLAIELFSIETAFGLSTLLFLTGGILMLRESKKERMAAHG